jgi:hypothetical protein
VNVYGDLTKPVAVHAGVVGAEEELSAAEKLDAEVGACAATVTPVGRSQPHRLGVLEGE